MKIVSQALTFFLGVRKPVSASEMLQSRGFVLVDEDVEGNPSVCWRRPMTDGFIAIENAHDRVDVDPEEPCWNVTRHHFNGGRIELLQVELSQALEAKLISPVHRDGSPIFVSTDDASELDCLWFMASRAPTGNAPINAIRPVANVVPLNTRSFGQDLRASAKRDLPSAGAEIVPFRKAQDV